MARSVVPTGTTVINRSSGQRQPTHSALRKVGNYPAGPARQKGYSAASGPPVPFDVKPTEPEPALDFAPWTIGEKSVKGKSVAAVGFFDIDTLSNAPISS
jgi:hypothetical protein